MASEMKICIQNLGRYNEGDLRFEWLDMPAEQSEIDAALKKIGIGPIYEEYKVVDVEGFTYKRWGSIDHYNKIANRCKMMAEKGISEECAEQIAQYLVGERGIEDDSEFENAVDEITVIDREREYGSEYSTNDDDKLEIGWYFATADGLWDYLKERNVENYFDFAAWGDDMAQDYNVYSDKEKIYLVDMH